jgi:hypothetical protein
MKLSKERMLEISEMFKLSQVITSTEVTTPFSKVRENVEKYDIKENEFKEYLSFLNPKEYQIYIRQIVQAIYHPMENVFQISLDSSSSLS